MYIEFQHPETQMTPDLTPIRSNTLSASRLAAWLACTFLIWAAVCFAMPSQQGLLAGCVCAVIGLVLALLSPQMRGGLRVRGLHWPGGALRGERMGRAHYAAVGGGALLLALLAESNTGLFSGQLFYGLSPGWQGLMLAGGLAGLVWGAGAGPGPGTMLRAALRGLRGRTTQVVLLLTLAALALRLILLEETLRLLVDEMNTIGYMLRLRSGQPESILLQMTEISPFAWPFTLAQYGGVLLLGPTLAGMRAASALAGALSVPAVYLLGRELFDKRVGLTAALLLATLPLHLHMSRLALMNIMDALLGPLLFYVLLRALRRGQRMDFVLAGGLLGLTHYFYEGGRLFFTPLVGLWLLCGLLFWPRWLRGRWPGLRLTAAVFLLAAAPLYYTWAAAGLPLAGRMGQAGVGSDYLLALLLTPASGQALQTLLGQIGRAALLLVGLPEQSLFYGGSTALLLPLLVPFFLLGLACTLRRWGTPAALLPLWAGGVVLANGLLLVQSASVPRYVLLLPALALLVAAGLWQAGHLLLAAPAPVRRLAVSGALLLALMQGLYYFGPHLVQFNVQARLELGHADIEDVALRSAGFPPGTHIHLITDRPVDGVYAQHFLDYLAPGLHFHVVPLEQMGRAYLRVLPRAPDHAFYVFETDVWSAQLVREHFRVEGPQHSPYWTTRLREPYVLYYWNSTLELTKLELIYP